MMTTAHMLELTEYQTTRLPASALTRETARLIWDRYGRQIDLQGPDFRRDHWELTPLGVVGCLPVSEACQLFIRPKVPLANLFRMLEYAYRLDFLMPGELVGCDSLEEFYSRLAAVLARRVLDRARRGLYREYTPRQDRLPYVRGRMDVARLVCEPWQVEPDCRYHELAADTADNRILAWTLHTIARSGLCEGESQGLVQRAWRALQHTVSLEPCLPRDCLGRLYNRLSEDYQPLHSLCRFFLEHSGPEHERGERTMLPFLINMGRLFELFVAEWLHRNLPAGVDLKVQEQLVFGEGQYLRFKVDLVLTESATSRPLCALDTKYKVAEAADQADISQVVTYAEALGCHEAALIYPAPLARPLDIKLTRIRARSVVFPLGGDLDQQGRQFFCQLAPVLEPVTIGR